MEPIDRAYRPRAACIKLRQALSKSSSPNSSTREIMHILTDKECMHAIVLVDISK